MSKNRPNLEFFNGIGAGSVVVDNTPGGTIIIPERNGGQGYSYIYIRNLSETEDLWITIGGILVPVVGTGILLKGLEWWEGDARGMATGEIKGLAAAPVTVSYLLGD